MFSDTSFAVGVLTLPRRYVEALRMDTRCECLCDATSSGRAKNILESDFVHEKSGAPLWDGGRFEGGTKG